MSTQNAGKSQTTTDAAIAAATVAVAPKFVDDAATHAAAMKAATPQNAKIRLKYPPTPISFSFLPILRSFFALLF